MAHITHVGCERRWCQLKCGLAIAATLLRYSTSNEIQSGWHKTTEWFHTVRPELERCIQYCFYIVNLGEYLLTNMCRSNFNINARRLTEMNVLLGTINIESAEMPLAAVVFIATVKSRRWIYRTNTFNDTILHEILISLSVKIISRWLSSSSSNYINNNSNNNGNIRGKTIKSKVFKSSPLWHYYVCSHSRCTNVQTNHKFIHSE